MRSVLHLQAADAHGQPGRAPGVDHAPRCGSADRSEPSASAQRRGASTPNCQRIWFLRRRRPVRVQHVALVQHGVGDGAGGGEAVARPARIVTPSSPASFSSRSKVWSQVGQRARGLEPRGARRASRGSTRTSRCSGSSGPSSPATPPPAAGTTPPRATRPARPTNPAAPARTTVPENSRRSGISPSSSAWKYLAAATSKS